MYSGIERKPAMQMSVPYLRVRQYVAVVVETDEPDRCIRTIGPIVGERELDRPQQREDVDRQQQQYRRRNEQPGDRSVGHAAEPQCKSTWGPGNGPLGKSAHVRPVVHGSGHDGGGGLPTEGREPCSASGSILPSSLNTFCQSLTRRSSAS